MTTSEHLAEFYLARAIAAALALIAFFKILGWL